MPSDITSTAISELLAQRGISQREFAKRLGWSVMKTHRRLTGQVEITIPELHEVAAALDVQTSDLLGDK